MNEPLPHSQDLRKGRVSQPQRSYHIRTSTHEREPIFADLPLGRLVVQSLRFLHERGDVESLAFVVMPHHLHWLLTLQGTQTLDAVIRAMKRHTAREINRHRGRTGQPVWQPGYFDRAIRAEDDIPAIARYIVSNPVRAELCRSVRDYSLWDAVWL